MKILTFLALFALSALSQATAVPVRVEAAKANGGFDIVVEASDFAPGAALALGDRGVDERPRCA